MMIGNVAFACIALAAVVATWGSPAAAASDSGMRMGTGTTQYLQSWPRSGAWTLDLVAAIPQHEHGCLLAATAPGLVAEIVEKPTSRLILVTPTDGTIPSFAKVVIGNLTLDLTPVAGGAPTLATEMTPTQASALWNRFESEEAMIVYDGGPARVVSLRGGKGLLTHLDQCRRLADASNKVFQAAKALQDARPQERPRPNPTIAPAAHSPLGPSFDCGRASAPLEQLICQSPDLSRIDLEFAQAYYALRQSAGPAGMSALKREAIAFQARVLGECRIAQVGAPPSDTVSASTCVQLHYAAERNRWLSRLQGDGLDEASRTLEMHVALQRDLQTLGFLPATATIDGVYGDAVRSAILAWQRSHGLPETGLLGDTNAIILAASVTSGQPAPDAVTAGSPGQAPPPSDAPTAASGQQDEYAASITDVGSMRVSDWKTFWLYAVPKEETQISLCVPTVIFRITNNSNEDLGNVKFTASFLNEAAKTTFGSGTTAWYESLGQPALPPGFSRVVVIHSSMGYVLAPGSCMDVPVLTVLVKAKPILGDPVTVGTSKVHPNFVTYSPAITDYPSVPADRLVRLPSSGAMPPAIPSP